jgi:hypothetical protein
MENLKQNYAKKLARLRYRDEILRMSLEKKSIREITKLINFRLARTNLKITLSRDTIQKIIKKGNLCSENLKG